MFVLGGMFILSPTSSLPHADQLWFESSGALSHKDTLEEAIVSVKRNGVALCGTLRTPLGFMSQRSLNLQLRYVYKSTAYEW